MWTPSPCNGPSVWARRSLRQACLVCVDCYEFNGRFTCSLNSEKESGYFEWILCVIYSAFVRLWRNRMFAYINTKLMTNLLRLWLDCGAVNVFCNISWMFKMNRHASRICESDDSMNDFTDKTFVLVTSVCYLKAWQLGSCWREINQTDNDGYLRALTFQSCLFPQSFLMKNMKYQQENGLDTVALFVRCKMGVNVCHVADTELTRSLRFLFCGHFVYADPVHHEWIFQVLPSNLVNLPSF